MVGIVLMGVGVDDYCIKSNVVNSAGGCGSG